MTKHPLHPGREAALKHELDHGILYFSQFAQNWERHGSCTTQAQVDAAEELAGILARERAGLNQTSLFPETGNAA